MMNCSNGPSMDQKEEVEKFLFAARTFKKGAVHFFCRQTRRPQCASASKAKSSVLSEFSGLENVLFNDFCDNFMDDELDSEDMSVQRTSAFARFCSNRVGGRACCK